MKILLALFVSIAVALPLESHARALIANCKLKSYADVKSMPSPGDDHLSYKVPDAIDVEVYDQYGSQWAYITGEYQGDVRVVGWALRSSLEKCLNTRPWK